MSSNGKHIVFVYGTLKTGYRNHDVILNPRNGSAKFLDAAETLFQYPLIVNSEFHVPLLLHFEGEGEHVEGELYEVDDTMLSSLDELEGHPHFYQRLVTKVKTVGKTSPTHVLECWVYFITTYRQELLDLPMLRNYTDTGQFKVPPEEKERRVAKIKLFIKGSN